MNENLCLNQHINSIYKKKNQLLAFKKKNISTRKWFTSATQRSTYNVKVPPLFVLHNKAIKTPQSATVASNITSIFAQQHNEYVCVYIYTQMVTQSSQS